MVSNILDFLVLYTSNGDNLWFCNDFSLKLFTGILTLQYSLTLANSQNASCVWKLYSVSQKNTSSKYSYFEYHEKKNLGFNLAFVHFFSICHVSYVYRIFKTK